MSKVSKISTGQDNTLETWISLSSIAFGEDSRATKFLIEKAENSPEGVKTEVIADERQLLLVLGTLAAEDIKGL